MVWLILRGMNSSKCPISGCTATTFKVVSIAQSKMPGAEPLRLVQCEAGHVLGTDTSVAIADLKKVISDQNDILKYFLNQMKGRS